MFAANLVSCKDRFPGPLANCVTTVELLSGSRIVKQTTKILSIVRGKLGKLSGSFVSLQQNTRTAEIISQGLGQVSGLLRNYFQGCKCFLDCK